MRFPVDPPAPVGFAEDLYEIQPTNGISPLRPLGPRPEQALIVRPRRPPPPPQRVAGEDTRKNEDRRQADRRKYVQVALVDTRLGRDRRHERRRPDDPPPPSIDEEA